MDEETLRLRASTLGIDHPDTLVSRNNLAFAHTISGRWAEAVPLYEDNLRRYESKLGPDHPGTLNARNNLANAYEALGRWAAAEPLRRDNLARRREAKNPDSLTIAGELAVLGRNLGEQSKWTEAETTLRECLVIREQAIADHWLTFNTMSQLGGALLGQRRFAEAEPLIVHGYEGLKRREPAIPPTSRARLREAGDRVIRLYETWNKPEKASEWKTRLGLVDLPDDVFART
jgi:tetratricopeptide (TPR) repeat protein